MAASRTPEIMADSAYAILTSKASKTKPAFTSPKGALSLPASHTTLEVIMLNTTAASISSSPWSSSRLTQLFIPRPAPPPRSAPSGSPVLPRKGSPPEVLSPSMSSSSTLLRTSRLRTRTRKAFLRISRDSYSLESSPKKEETSLKTALSDSSP